MSEAVSLTDVREGCENDALESLRHTASHVLAQALKRLYGPVQLGTGPTIEDGFYYDFRCEKTVSDEDLPAIEEEMRRIVAEKLPVAQHFLPRGEAFARLEERGEPFKVELLRGFADEQVSFFAQGEFWDLCRGPHAQNTQELVAFKLLSVSGAYWRADERNPQMQRVYGTAFLSQQELDEHLHRLEEAKRRDHRRLGRELDLFSIHHEEFGAGLVFWHPKGAFIRQQVEDFWRDEHRRRGYQFLNTPHVANLDLWKTSGHWDFYRENMFSPLELENTQMMIKPMNCPGHILVFKSKLHSYRDLPVRYAELGTVYRYEKSGVLHGLMRVRGFTQDDAHIFCTPQQLEGEIEGVLELVRDYLGRFGFDDYEVYLSTRPEKSVGSDDLWEIATAALRQALEKSGLKWQVDPGEGVFYGPKIDLKIRDSLKRTWQCSTIQVDFNNPERFKVEYVDEDNQRHPVVMVHRAIMGSLERFFGILIEHFAGEFPLWLAPEQVWILRVSDKFADYAREVAGVLAEAGIRAVHGPEGEKLGKQIRLAQQQKAPYMFIVGGQEAENRTVSLRDLRGNEEKGVTLSDAVARILDGVKAGS